MQITTVIVEVTTRLRTADWFECEQLEDQLNDLLPLVNTQELRDEVLRLRKICRKRSAEHVTNVYNYRGVIGGIFR